MKGTISVICVLLLLAGFAWAQGADQSNQKDAIKFKKAQGVSDPVLIKKVTPTYPDEARKAMISGTVIIEAIIGVDGKVASTKVVESPNPILSKAAEDAVKKWEFEPAKDQSGRAVQVESSITVKFMLK